DEDRLQPVLPLEHLTHTGVALRSPVLLPLARPYDYRTRRSVQPAEEELLRLPLLIPNGNVPDGGPRIYAQVLQELEILILNVLLPSSRDSFGGEEPVQVAGSPGVEPDLPPRGGEKGDQSC